MPQALGENKMIENSYCESCKEGTIHYTENDRQICSRCHRKQ